MNSSEIVRISSEWLDANKSRAYPFDDECADAPGRLPTEIFTDAFFAVSGLGGEPLYMSRLVLGANSFQVYVATESVDIGLIADIRYDTPERSQIVVSVDNGDGVKVSGVLVLGDASVVKTLPADNVLDLSNGKLFLGCVRELTVTGIRGIKVNNTIYSGVVDLVAGDGITLDVESSQSETKIYIKAKDRTLPTANTLIVSDKTLLHEITELYGPVVSMINGVKPDSKGNVTLAYPDDGQGYVAFPSSDSESGGTIILKDSSTNVVECENALVKSIMANIDELNNRAARLADTVNALDTANNVMSVSLSRIV